MDSVPTNVLLTICVPFFQMRDLKSLQAVSKSMRARLSNSQDLYDLSRHVCGYGGCANRAFLYLTVDPFVDYIAPVPTDYGTAFVNSVKCLCLFPVYSIPFCRILYHLYQMVKQEPTGHRSDTPVALGTALASYSSVGRWLATITCTRAMEWCTCVDRIERHSGHRGVTCVHTGWCTRTEKGGCVGCVLTKTIDNLQWCALPSSFYIYSLVYLLVPLFFGLVVFSFFTVTLGMLFVMWSPLIVVGLLFISI